MDLDLAPACPRLLAQAQAKALVAPAKVPELADQVQVQVQDLAQAQAQAQVQEPLALEPVQGSAY